MGYVLGLVAVLLIICNTTLFFSRRLNKYVYGGHSVWLQKYSNFIRKPHMYLGATIFIVGLAHAYFMFGLFSPYTGLFVLTMVLIMALTATFGKKFKITNWISAHRIEAVVLIALVILHFLITRSIIKF